MLSLREPQGGQEGSQGSLQEQQHCKGVGTSSSWNASSRHLVLATYLVFTSSLKATEIFSLPMDDKRGWEAYYGHGMEEAGILWGHSLQLPWTAGAQAATLGHEGERVQRDGSCQTEGAHIPTNPGVSTATQTVLPNSFLGEK